MKKVKNLDGVKKLIEGIEKLIIETEDTFYDNAPRKMNNSEASAWTQGFHDFREKLKEVIKNI